MAIPVNPYVAGNPVGGTPAFVGRVDVLREIRRVLDRPLDNAIVLFGQRRIGKTSVLHHLAVQLSHEGLYYPVDFDLEQKAEWPLSRLLQELACTIAGALGQPDPDLGPEPETVFRQEWLPTVLSDLPDGSSLVLLFDEFDVLASREMKEAARGFFSYLHNLLTLDPGRLQFVFVIGRNVDDLYNIALSLFRDVPAKRVSLLNREDTDDLVSLSEANGTLLWPDKAVERVWQLTQGHPYLTQQICSYVWHRTYDEEDEKPDVPPTAAVATVDAAVPEALEAGRHTLEFLWDGLPPPERVVAAALAEAGPDPITQQDLEELLSESGVRVVIRELQNAPQQLQDWDLIEPANGGYRFRVELVRRWIADHKPLQRVQKELDRIEPVAENLYKTGWWYYQNEQFGQALDSLRKAIGLNPNHVGANQLLIDILLAQGRVDEARKLLERLYEYRPDAARHRLVQAILTQAQAAESADEQMALYRQVLDLAPAQREATTKIAEIELKKLEALEQQRRYQNALDLARGLADKYPGVRDWTSDLGRLKRKVDLDGLYQQGVGALQGGDRETAQTLLAQVIAEEPGYEQATRYLHQAVTGRRVPWSYIVIGLLLIISIILATWLLTLGALSTPTVSSFAIQEPRNLLPQQEYASVSGYLECSDRVRLAEIQIVVYVVGVKPDREEEWRRSRVPCAPQVGRQWAISSECIAFPEQYSEFAVIAVLVSSDDVALLPPKLVADDGDELRDDLSEYAYSCSGSTPCSSISPTFQVSRLPHEPTATPTSSPTPSPTSTSSPTPSPTATLTLTPSRTPTPTPTHTATATSPPPTETATPRPSRVTPTPTSTVTPTRRPPPTNTRRPPPTNTRRPPPTNTRRPPPTNTPSS